MAINGKVSGDWQNITDVYARAGGSWREVEEVFARDGGSWYSIWKNTFEFSITSNQTNANLRTLAVNAGWDEETEVIATINSGVVISGNTQGASTPALLIDGSWPNGVTLINKGVIVGKGGDGGVGCCASYTFQGWDGSKFVYDANAYGGSAGAAGGRALLVHVPVKIDNQGQISGGGGGGGGGGSAVNACASSGGGGGGGRSSNDNSSGGDRGSTTVSDGFEETKGGNGSAGTFAGAGSGGARADWANYTGGTANLSARGGAGGNGGDRGSQGTGGGNPELNDDSYPDDNDTRNGRSGGGAGEAVNGNSNITWVNTGTRNGPIV